MSRSVTQDNAESLARERARQARAQEADRIGPDHERNDMRKGARIFLRAITEFQTAKTKDEQ
jgi:hypothetical protein